MELRGVDGLAAHREGLEGHPLAAGQGHGAHAHPGREHVVGGEALSVAQLVDVPVAHELVQGDVGVHAAPSNP